MQPIASALRKCGYTGGIMDRESGREVRTQRFYWTPALFLPGRSDLAMTLYRVGLGRLNDVARLMILTTRDLAAVPQHVVVEYRQHGRKFYLLVPDEQTWYARLLANPMATIQARGEQVAAQFQPVTDPGERERALRLFGRTPSADTPLIARLDKLPQVFPPMRGIPADQVWLLPASVVILTASFAIMLLTRSRR
jgi:hypothetical protein